MPRFLPNLALRWFPRAVLAALLVPLVLTACAEPPLPPSGFLEARDVEPGVVLARDTTVTLTIDRYRRMAINGVAVAPDSLEARLRAIYAEPRPDQVLYVQAAPEIAEAELTAAFDLASRTGVRVIGKLLNRGESAAYASPS